MSSVDAKQVSLTVRGFLLGIIPLAMALTGFTEADIVPVVDAIVQLVFLLLSVVSAVQVLVGLGRKLYLKRWTSA